MKHSNIYLGLLVIQILILFMPLLNPSNILSSDQSDLVFFLLPIMKNIAADNTNFHITYWNNYIYSGAPFFADFHSFIFSPFNLLYYIFDINFAITLTILLHFIIGAIAFFYYIKIGLSATIFLSDRFICSIFLFLSTTKTSFVSTSKPLPFLPTSFATTKSASAFFRIS